MADHSGSLKQLTQLATMSISRGKPLFVLVQYQHQADKLQFIEALAEKSLALPFNIRRYDPKNNPEHGSGKLYQQLVDDVERGVLSLVVSIAEQEDHQPEHDFLSYINFQRDRIVQHKLHWVLFIHTSQAEAFIRGAPDLWSFRHHTFYLERFDDQQQADSEHSQQLMWQSLNDAQQQLTLDEQQKAAIQTHVAHSRQLIDNTAGVEDKARLMLDLSRWLQRHYALTMAAEVAIEGSALKGLDDDLMVARFEYQAGKALRQNCHYPEALAHYHQALALISPEQESLFASHIYNDMGVVYQSCGQYPEAVDCYQQAHRFGLQINDIAMEMDSLINLASVLIYQQQYEQALADLQQALALNRQLDNKVQEAAILSNIAFVYSRQGQYQQALAQQRQVYALFEQVGDKANAATALNNMAGSLIHLQQYDAVLEPLNQAHELALACGNKPALVSIYINFGHYFEHFGDIPQAIDYHKKAVALAGQIDDPNADTYQQWLDNLTLRYKVEH